MLRSISWCLGLGPIFWAVDTDSRQGVAFQLGRYNVTKHFMVSGTWPGILGCRYGQPTRGGLPAWALQCYEIFHGVWDLARYFGL